MSRSINNQYDPDYVSPPGETLQETLETLGMSQASLAERTGRSLKMINEIIKGKAPITPKMALELERVVSVTASFWNNRERNYREFAARIEEQKRLETFIAWLENIPVRAMVKYGWIDHYRNKVEQLQEVLKFFRIASPEQWPVAMQTYLGNAAFRRSQAFESDFEALVSWLRKGELNAKKMFCEPYDAKEFRSILKQIRILTLKPPEIFQPEVKKLCASCGVAAVFVPELPKTRVSGATRWLTPAKALIQLSLRYKTDDHLWFSFFHEAGHILKHGKRDVFIEGTSLEMDETKEEEANIFAADYLIPKREYLNFTSRYTFSKANIRKFASQIQISPGIVVGRLQHDKLLPITHCNDLKIRFKWA